MFFIILAIIIMCSVVACIEFYKGQLLIGLVFGIVAFIFITFLILHYNKKNKSKDLDCNGLDCLDVGGDALSFGIFDCDGLDCDGLDCSDLDCSGIDCSI